MSQETFIDKFLARPENELFVRIDDDFIQNTFNLYGIKAKLENFAPAYELLKKNQFSERNLPPEVTASMVEKCAETLYGLLHARFLLTRAGMNHMYNKYVDGVFQMCPRVYCKGVCCLPYGISEELGESVKMFCPCCFDVYTVLNPIYSAIDGAFFGPSWVHMFLNKHSQIIPTDPIRVYVPKIFGFRIYHPSDVEEEEEEDQSED